MQYDFDFDGPFSAGDNPALWSPREIWVKLNQRLMAHIGEDRRIDYKQTAQVREADLATFMSMFSNTPDGGVIVYGADSKGNPTGCNNLSQSQLNQIEQ